MSISATVMQLYQFYEARQLERVIAALPDDFRFDWPFAAATSRYAGSCHSKAQLLIVLGDLAANFDFHSYRATNILVDGDRAAAQLQLELTSKATGRRFTAQIAHFWTFRDGKPAHLVEYMDTALMTSESLLRP